MKELMETFYDLLTFAKDHGEEDLDWDTIAGDFLIASGVPVTTTLKKPTGEDSEMEVCNHCEKRCWRAAVAAFKTSLDTKRGRVADYERIRNGGRELVWRGGTRPVP